MLLLNDWLQIFFIKNDIIVKLYKELYVGKNIMLISNEFGKEILLTTFKTFICDIKISKI